jgi:hypothetical protein
MQEQARMHQPALPPTLMTLPPAQEILARCSTCNSPIEWRERVGFTTYARPCGHKITKQYSA